MNSVRSAGESISDERTHHSLSIDVEGFVESMRESFHIHESCFDAASEAEEIRMNTEMVLDLLDDLRIIATFFILGRIARDQPETVRRIAARGHEIACHSMYHKRISGQTPREFREDVATAKSLLEDIAGCKVSGFRAPDFSIISDDLWELDILGELGFEYDSSLIPTDIHDIYGNPGQERHIHWLKNGMLEYPPSTFTLFGRTIPFGGGGYVRLYPIRLTRLLIQMYEKAGEPCMIYIHPYELGPRIPSVKPMSLYRRFRHYHNASSGASRIPRILKGFAFDTCISILRRRSLESNE